ncbi:MAG TPA: hypothetical protein VFM12_07420 [Gemmatimonadales bacterium]|nr:hypothetical protein [Gemmatimonadales bacterium]
MSSPLRRAEHTRRMKVLDAPWALLTRIGHFFHTAPLATTGILFPALVLLAAWRRRRSLPRPLRWMCVYLALTLLEDFFMIYWSRAGRHNLWIMNLYTPFEAAMFGMMYAGWQLRERWRTVVYAVTALFLVFWLVLILTIEPITEFSRFTKSVEALLVIAVAAWTLVQRSRHTAAPLTAHAWFWVSVGTLLYFAYFLLLNPVSLLLSTRLDLLVVVYEINGAMVIVMYLFWLRATLLVRRPSKAEARA